MRAIRAFALSRVILALTVAVAACSDAESRTTEPLRAQTPVPTPSVALGAAATTARDEGPNALGTIPLPINQTYLGTATALKLTHNGASGSVANFISTNASNTATALVVTKGGTLGTGTGTALGVFQNNAASQAAIFQVTNASSTREVVQLDNSGKGHGLQVYQPNLAGTGSGVLVQNYGQGWAGSFYGFSPGSKGVYIETSAGAAGLQVVGGSKNAVVGTSSGARALYTEESAEVWFTDYGMGRLTGGRSHVTFDVVFRETIAVQAGYHVFVQSYGDADLIVKNRTSGGFDVVRRGGGEDAEFSYRIVARRKGFESKRLERAPWADEAVARKRLD